VHVSTAYVNSDKEGWINEAIYDSDLDAESIVDKILKIPSADIEKQTK